jgi:hypothetical protein
VSYVEKGTNNLTNKNINLIVDTDGTVKNVINVLKASIKLTSLITAFSSYGPSPDAACAGFSLPIEPRIFLSAI